MDHDHLHKSPWHAGEKKLQEVFHASGRMDEIGPRVIRDYMPDQHREFYQQLPFMVVGAVDADDRPWATVIEGAPGFVSSVDSHHLHLNAQPDAQDPAASGLMAGKAIGMLGIELHTRRRNRVNGVIQQTSTTGLEVLVEQSYGNCPKYIQGRTYTQIAKPETATAARRDFNALDEQASAWITAADTFFIASYVDDAGQRSVDVSHRGGRAGFVDVQGNRLTIPDYAGNLFFNTLGNLQANPVAGLLFIDFTTGDTLQLTGRTQLLLDSPLINSFEGAERLWTFDVEHVVIRPAALKTRWLFRDYAPTSLATGTWAETAERLRTSEQRRRWQQWRVTGVQQESSDIRSLFLEPADGGPIRFQPGQHLALRIDVGEGDPLLRTYSISSAPSDGHIRVSVKLQGHASRHLHDKVQVGDWLNARPPLGGFTLSEDKGRPVVLMGAGVGITPLISMARELVAENLHQQRKRHVHLFQSARSLDELPFQEELIQLQQRSGGSLHVHRTLSNPGEAVLDRDYQIAGRLDFDQVKARLPLDDYDFYLCGPAGFLQTMYDGLRGVNIADGRIHAEAFGPSALQRLQTSAPPVFAQPDAASAPVDVTFSASATQARWQPGGATLLELAESQGLSPEFSCRGGSCGTCSTRLISGRVHYPNPPAQMPADNQVLICCAVPGHDEQDARSLVLDL